MSKGDVLKKCTGWASAGFAALGLIASPGLAETAKDDKTVTEKVLDILKEQGSIDEDRYDELMREAQAEKTEALPGVASNDEWDVYWKDGVRIERKDGAAKIKIGGRIQFDAAAIGSSNRLQRDFDTDGTGTDFRRARIFMSGSISENGIFKAEYDFAGGDVDFADVYIGLTKLPVVGTVRVGHMKEAFGLEELTSSKYITFMERSLPILAFAPGRNSGIGINDTAFDERMTWAIGGFQEVGSDGEDFSNQGEYNVTARVTGLPVYEDEGKQLVHVGYSYSHKFRNSENIDFDSKPEANLAKNLVLTPDLSSNGVDLFGGELATVLGPLSIQGELIGVLVDGSQMANRQFYGASAQVSYFLTGENRVYDVKTGSFGRTSPAKPFSISKGQWGAFEVAARYSHINLNDGAVRGGILSDYTIGLNWYLYRNLRIVVNGITGHLNGVGDTYIAQSRVAVDF
jgi:phosphate-selective porin OprO/OprP